MAQTTYNPFEEVLGGDSTDLDLIQRSRQGDRHALEALILRHQSWIYNIAIRMVFDPLAAEDITQEVLIKIITKLSSYDPARSAFRTWVYRIVVNHVINAKRSRREAVMEEAMKGEKFEEFIKHLPDKKRAPRPGAERFREDLKIACVQCILLCLKRRERMVFILGVIFGVSDAIGSEICEISKANFRKILSRSRQKVYGFFHGNCGLLNEKNPCRCTDYMDSLVNGGMMDTDNLLTLKESHGSVREVIAGSIETIEDSYAEFVSLFRNQPFLKSPDTVKWLQKLMNKEDVRSLLRIEAV